MTDKEAMQMAEKTCKDCLTKKGMCTEEDRDECWIYNAKAALFYRTPEKLEIRTRNYCDRRYCSYCHRQIGRSHNYCPKCGKAIDWDYGGRYEL